MKTKSPELELDLSPKKARRSQALRSQETKERLLKATIETLLECGYAGVTTAQIDARAGVSSGARVHHFPTKADLVIAATKYAYDQMTELGQKRAEKAKNSKDPIKLFIDDCISIYFDWPFLSAIEVVLAARTDSQLMHKLRPVLGEFHEKMRVTWIEALVTAGYQRNDAETKLRLTLNLIRGMAVNRIWENDAAEYKKLLDIWSETLDLGTKKTSERNSTRAL